MLPRNVFISWVALRNFTAGVFSWDLAAFILALRSPTFYFVSRSYSSVSLCNCILNRKIAKDCSKPLVGCLNRNLNLQVNRMIRDMPDLGSQIDSVQNTMSATKSSTKNSAILRNITHLHPQYQMRQAGQEKVLCSIVSSVFETILCQRATRVRPISHWQKPPVSEGRET